MVNGLKLYFLIGISILSYSCSFSCGIFLGKAKIHAVGLKHDRVYWVSQAQLTPIALNL